MGKKKANKKKADEKARTNGASADGTSRADEPDRSGSEATTTAGAGPNGAGSSPNGTGSAPREAPQTALERRREKLRSRVRALEAAEQEVSRLERELDHTARVTREQESSLAAATARVAALEQALMTSHHERAGLQAALEGVRADVERARERAALAERKYDRAVLAEVVRREKAVDLALHAT